MAVVDLYKHAETVEKELKEYAENENRQEAITDFLSRVLEIRKEQILVAGQWKTYMYKFLITYGGPNIWIDTHGSIEVAWGSNSLNYIINDKEVLGFLESVEDYLNQAFP